VFISYSWDSVDHCNWVEGLARSQTRAGLEVMLDRWDTKLGTDLLQYMETAVRRSRRVIVVCTPIYAKRSRRRVGGVGYETCIITGELFHQIGLPSKFIPLLRIGNPSASLPVYLRSKLYADFRTDVNFDRSLSDLVDDILDKSRRPSNLRVG
jgi:hypothetical protein